MIFAPYIPYKVTIMRKHTSCQKASMHKISFSFENVGFIHESKQTHRQA
jgi:hypothetical protein